MLRDLWFALRSLRKNKGSTLVILLTLAFGFGANTVVFSLVYNVLLRPLPYPEADRLVRAYSTRFDGTMRLGASVPDFMDWREAVSAFEVFEMYRYRRAKLNGDEEIVIQTLEASPRLLELAGSRALRGRLLQEGDMRADAPPVVILTYEFWKGRFAGDDAAVSGTLRLDETTYSVIGVLEPIEGPLLRRVQAIRPWNVGLGAGYNRGSRGGLEILGRLKCGVSLEQAQAELKAIGEKLSREYPLSNRDMTTLLVSFREEVVAGFRPSLLALMGATGLILLIAIANIANLQLAKGEKRRFELSIRTALGASRGRVARLLLAESVLLSALGGMAGVGAGYSLIQVLLANPPVEIPRQAEFALDWAFLTVAFASPLVCGLLFGLPPFLKLGTEGVRSGLQSMTHLKGWGNEWVRSGLVIAQLALCLILLTGSGLMIRSFLKLRNVPLGIDYEQILTFSDGSLGVGRFPDRGSRLHRYRGLIEHLKAIPGVSDVTLTSQTPLSGGWNAYSLKVLGGQRQGEVVLADLLGVNPDFFRFFDSQTIDGRLFQPEDLKWPDQVVVVDAKLAELVWPGSNAVGQRLGFWAQEVEVIGVVEPIRYGDLAEEMRPKLYNLLDHPIGAVGGTFLIRHDGKPGPIMEVIKARAREVDATLSIDDLQPLENYYDYWLREPRFYLAILGSLGALGLLVAVVGVYGVISYSVGQRTEEIGIRMALGAKRSQIVQLICRSALFFLTVGLSLGLLGALWLTRYLQSLLFEIDPADPIAIASTAGLLAMAALAATLVPTCRALRVDPAKALRSE